MPSDRAAEANSSSLAAAVEGPRSTPSSSPRSIPRTDSCLRKFSVSLSHRRPGLKTNLYLLASASCFVPSRNAVPRSRPTASAIAVFKSPNILSLFGVIYALMNLMNVSCDGLFSPRIYIALMSYLPRFSRSLREPLPRANPKSTAANRLAGLYLGLPLEPGGSSASNRSRTPERSMTAMKPSMSFRSSSDRPANDKKPARSVINFAMREPL